MSQLPDGETPPGILHLPFIGKTSSSKISISRTLIVRNKIVSVNLFQILAIVLTTPPQNISRMFWTGKSAGTWTPPTRSLLLFSNAFANTPSQRLSFYFTNTKLSSRPLQWRSGLLPLLPVPFYHIRALFSIANPGQIFSAICLAGILSFRNAALYLSIRRFFIFYHCNFRIPFIFLDTSGRISWGNMEFLWLTPKKSNIWKTEKAWLQQKTH